MSKIELTDSISGAIFKISEGNPGALSVLNAILKHGASIDPDALDPFLTILHFDTLGLRGPKAWMLFKDVCGQHVGKTIALLRACQLGFVNIPTLQHAVNNRGQGIDVDALVKKVQERLPNFNLEGASK